MTAGFHTLTSKLVRLPVNDIDTDQIIPARFLKVVDKVGLGEKLFFDWRYLEDGGSNPDFALNRPGASGREVLVAGDNFGCGSSREHAPWALVDWGLRAVISTSFADIFKNNALKNGLLPIEVDADIHEGLLKADDDVQVTVDLETQVIVVPGGRAVRFPIDAFARRCLLEGTDQLGYLLGFDDAISAFEEKRAGA